MHISYIKLWILLVERGISKPELRRLAGLSSSVMTKMNKGEPVSISNLLKICSTLHISIGDIMEVVFDESAGVQVR